MFALDGAQNVLPPKYHHASPSALSGRRDRPEARLQAEQGVLGAPDGHNPQQAGPWMGSSHGGPGLHILACECNIILGCVQELRHSSDNSS